MSLGIVDNPTAMHLASFGFNGPSFAKYNVEGKLEFGEFYLKDLSFGEFLAPTQLEAYEFLHANYKGFTLNVKEPYYAKSLWMAEIYHWSKRVPEVKETHSLNYSYAWANKRIIAGIHDGSFYLCTTKPTVQLSQIIESICY